MNLWQYAVPLGYQKAEAPLYDTARLLAGSTQSPTAGLAENFQKLLLFLKYLLDPDSFSSSINFFVLLSPLIFLIFGFFDLSLCAAEQKQHPYI
jgi:hypothetical protein